MKVPEIVEKIRRNELMGLSEETIAKFEKTINWRLPQDYREIIKTVEGGYGDIGECYIEFWTLNEMFFYFEEMEDLEGLIPFASDGCGSAFAFDIKSNAIYSVHMDCLERSYAKIIAVNFNDFIDKLIAQKLNY